MDVALENIFLLSNTNIVHISKNAPAPACQFIFIYQSTVLCCSPARHSNLYLNQAHADKRDSVTTSVTLHYLCHSVSRGDREKLQCSAGWLAGAHTRTRKPEYKHISPPLKWPQVCAWRVHTHICKNRSALTCLLSEVFQTHTQELAHCTPALSNPLPCSKQPPSGLVRANPAVDSVAPIAAPPPLRVVREMKALGVHYKTTTAAAGDRPPGARSYPFSSLHPHLFPSCPSISQPQSTLLAATHSSLRVEKNATF